MTELKRQATTARSFGLEMHILGPREARDLWPLMDIADLEGRRLPADRWPGESLGYHPGVRQGRAARRAVTIIEDCAGHGIRGEERDVLQGC